MPLPQSADELVLLHNPRCSKSRATLALLEEHGASFELRAYLDDPLDLAELETLRGRLGGPVRDWVRLKEAAFEATGCTRESSQSELLKAVAESPILMERPILVGCSTAEIGRPPENVLKLLGKPSS